MRYIGVDIGGMSIKAGITDENGHIFAKKTVVTQARKPSEEIVGDIERLIRGLLEEQAANIETTPLTVLLLATTIYYSAQWTDEFNEAANYTDVFHAPAGDTEAEYMRAERGMDYFSGDGWGAVRLPLRGGNGAAGKGMCLGRPGHAWPDCHISAAL